MTKENFKTVSLWIIVAFFVGMAIRGGDKVMNRLWPDKPTVTVVEFRESITHRVVQGKEE
jgi:hypothetical protein